MLLDVVEKMVTIEIWQEGKNDGRLAYRGNGGVGVHFAVLVIGLLDPPRERLICQFKNLKKGGGSGGLGCD